VITLSGLYVYPVKSCRGIALERATLTPTGVQHDREWMIVTPAGRFITQRESPRLALIETRLGETSLVLHARGVEPLELPFAGAGRPASPVTVWGDHCKAFDAGAEASLWLERFLGHPARIVRFDASQPRAVEAAWSGGVAAFSKFADAFPVLVLSNASLADLNARLAKPLPMERFRPNFVLDGCAAYAEDSLGTIELGGVQLRMVKPCTRCIITTTDQATGERDGDEPLRTLKTYRWDKALKGVAFGQNAVVAAGAGGVIERGMQVQALH
jgi:uncharacterized protein YcbX